MNPSRCLEVESSRIIEKPSLLYVYSIYAAILLSKEGLFN
jgi:hypothetical protein